MICQLSGESFDPDGPLVFQASAETETDEITARVMRAPTLDGSVVVEHYGVVHGDRELTLSAHLDEAQSNRLTALMNFNRVWLSIPEGLFLGVIRARSGTGPVKITFWPALKVGGPAEPVPVAPAPPALPLTISVAESGYWLTGDTSLRTSALSVGLSGSSQPMYGWLRFDNIGYAPPEALGSATLILRGADYPRTVPVTMSIRIVCADDWPAAPTTVAEVWDDGSATCPTAARLSFSIPVLATGEEVSIALNISAMGEVFSRPGWASGGAVVLVFQPESASLTAGTVAAFSQTVAELRLT